MAGMLTKVQRTYSIEDVAGVAMYRGVVYGATEGGCKKPVADNEVMLGVVCNDQRLDLPFQGSGSQAGKDVAVLIDGYPSIALSGVCSYGDSLILGAGGFAKKLPTAEGTYNVIGIAEKAGVDGDVIPMTIRYSTVVIPHVGA